MSHPRPTPPDATLPALNQFDFHAGLAAAAGTALVAFTAPGCGGCRHLRHVLLDVRRRQPDWHLFEVDAQRDQALASEFEVFHLPTVFLFRDGAFHCELRAEASTSAIVAAALEALRRPAEEAP